MSFRRRVAAGVAAIVALGTSAVGLAAAPPAFAAPVVTAITSTAPLWCWVVIDGASGPIGQISTTPAKYPNGLAGHVSVTHTLTLGTPAVDSPLSVTYAASEGPRNGPSGVTGEVAIATYRITGPSGPHDVTGTPSAPFNVAGNAWGPAFSVDNTIPASVFTTSGTYTVKILSLDFYAAGNFDAALGVSGSTGITTRCNSNDANVDGGAGGDFNPYPTDDNAYTRPLVTPIAASATIAGADPTTAPATPSGLAAAPGDGKVALTWNSVADADSYQVFRDGTQINSGADTTYTDNSATNGTEYSYTVRATNAVGSSPQSSAVKATPVAAAPVAPSAPTGLSATAGDGKVTLTWTGSAGATGYDVFRGDAKVGSTTAPTVTYVDATVANGTAYSYTVKAIGPGGTSGASTAASATPQAAPKSSVTATLSCNTLDNLRDWETTLSASLTGSSVNLAFAPGPKSGPVPLQAGWLQPMGTVTIAGVDVAVEGPKYDAIPKNTTVPGATLVGAVTGTPTSLTIKSIVFKDIGSGSNVDTTCTSASAITVPIVSGIELPPTLPTSDGDLVVDGTVVAGGTVTLSGDGFEPGGAVTAGMYSTPVTLGVGTASAQGAVQIAVVIPAGTTGTHTLVLYGVDQSGGPRTLTKEVSVAAPSATPTPTDTNTTDPTDDPDNPGTLPQTGPGDFGATLLWALVALQIGLIVAVRASRSRRPEPTTGRHRR